MSKWTDEEMLDALRTVLFDTPTTSHEVYDAERGDGDPSSQTVTIRFGSWNGALEKAGIFPTTSTPEEGTRARRYERSPETFIVQVMRYIVMTEDTDPSYAAFEEWQKDHAPSAVWLRTYCGIPWSEAKSCALQELSSTVISGRE